MYWFKKRFLFKKRFIFIIVFCFFPIILYPQDVPVFPYIWKDMRKVNTVIIQGHQHQEMDVVYLNFEPFTKDFFSFITSKDPQIPEEVRDNIHLGWSSHLMDLENMRLQMLKNILYSDNMQEQQNLVLIFKAIFSRDIDFFKNPTEEQRKLLKMRFSTKQLIGNKEVPLFITNFLLEAIRQSFLPAVQYILSNYHESDLMPKREIESLSLDPLSLSLVTYASLEPDDPLKEEAKKIISLLADHVDVNNTYNAPLGFDPITWSILLGLNDEVKFLHEQKKVDLDFKFRFQNWIVNPIDYANTSGFVQLGQYLQNKVGISNCEQTFLQ